MPRSPSGVLLALLTACAAPPWQPPPAGLPMQCGERSVFHADACVVVATDDDSAAQALEFYATVAEAVRKGTGRPAPRPLVLALAFDDELPVVPVDAYLAHLRAQHERVTGRPREIRPMEAPRTEDGREIEVDPSLGAKLLAFAVPRDDERLALPSSLREHTDLVLVMPTTECIEEISSEVLDAALDASDASIFERAMLLPMRGTITSRLVESMTAEMRIELLAALLPAGACTDEELAATCEALAVSPERVRGTGITDSEAERVQRSLARLRNAAHDSRLSTGAAPTPLLVQSYCVTSYTHFVDARPQPNESFATAAAAAGKQYLHMPFDGGVPDRPTAERFAALLPTQPRARVLVVGATDETGPLLVAAHAYHVARVGRWPAIDAAIEFGVTKLLMEFADSLPQDPPPPPSAK